MPAPAGYVGRFAPSPTGSLHIGSLVAALGSYLDARAAGGRWLVRMEDLDRERLVPQADQAILRTLEALGLHWDGAVLYQSERQEHYAAALALLRAQQATFECSCSRRELATGYGYPGTCRNGPKLAGPTATRFRVPEAMLTVPDRIQGLRRFELARLGDVIVRRRDGAFAYQLAVVVDDALQGVTDVVRGADLLDSTPWQIALQQALGLSTPRYAHLPLITEPDGAKLSKSRRSVAIGARNAAAELHRALVLLRQDPPAKLKSASVREILAWGIRHWQLSRLAGIPEVRLGPQV